MAFRTPEYIAEKIEDTMRDPEAIKSELMALEKYRLLMDKMEKILATTPMIKETEKPHPTIDDAYVFSGIEDLEDLAKEYMLIKTLMDKH